MKKDKEWLKAQICTEMMYLEHNRKERWSGVKYQTLRSVYQKINQLEEPRVLSQEWIDEHKVARVNNLRKMTMSDVVPVGDLQNLLVPKQELPVIPKYVAEIIEEVKASGDRLDDAFSILRDIYYQSKTADWVAKENRNSEIFARAWLDGYTVKEEQKYYARIKEWELFADFVGVQYWGIVSIYGRIGFVSADDAKDNTKDEWKRLGIDDSNAEFVEVAECD